MRKPLYDSWTSLAPSVSCSCGAVVTVALTSDSAKRPRVVVSESCGVCWPRWIERRLARAVEAGKIADFDMAVFIS